MERADEVARLETLHNGKPIFEVAPDRDSGRRRVPPVLRRLGRQDSRRDDPRQGQLPHLHAARAARRRRRDRAVELSAAARRRGRSRRRSPAATRHPQAGEPDAADRAGARRDRAWRSGCRRACSTSSPGRASEVGQIDRRAPGHRQDRVHRRHRRPARAIMRGAADTLKKITLELGGKSPNIVFADADIDAARARRDDRDFLRQGRGLRGRIAAAGRQVDQGRVHRQGRGAGEEDGRRRSARSQDALGAISSKKQLETVQRYIETAKKEGAPLVAGGERADIGTGKGYFFQPTVFDRRDAGDDHRARGDFRAGARDDRVRRRRRSDRPRQRLRATAWRRPSGRATSRRRTTSRGSCRPARSGSTRTTSTTRRRRSAATSRAASAAR